MLSVVVFAAALFALHRAIGRFDVDQVMVVARSYPAGVMVTALLLASASYGALSGFDWLALRHLGRPLPIGWTALISFVSHAVSHNAGFAVLTGGSVRLRMYSTFGLTIGEVASVVAFAGLTFALGTAVLAAGAFIAEGEKIAVLLHLPPPVVTTAGWGVALAVTAYLVWAARSGRPLAVGKWRFRPPSLGLGVGQIVVAATDLALVAGALYVLLPLPGTVSYPAFIGLYVVATLAGIISHVPGGLGVFEGTLLLLLPEAEPAAVLAALLVFRVFYNLLPLLLAAVVLAVFELIQRRRHAAAPAWIESLGPPLASALTFGAGAVVLLSGAVSHGSLLPAPLAEPAHLLSAAAGATLLIAAWGLARQNRQAWRAALAVLAASACLALLRGPDWIVAAVPASAAAVLAAASPLFDRRDALEPVPLGWIGAAAALVLGAFWLSAHASDEPLRRVLRGIGGPEGRDVRADLMAAVALAVAWGAVRIPSATGGRETSARPP